MKKVTLYKRDIVVLPKQVDISLNKEYNRKETMLTLNPVIMKCRGFLSEPESFGSSQHSIV